MNTNMATAFLGSFFRKWLQTVQTIQFIQRYPAHCQMICIPHLFMTTKWGTFSFLPLRSPVLIFYLVVFMECCNILIFLHKNLKVISFPPQCVDTDMSHIIISNFIQSLTKYVTTFNMCSYPSHWHSSSPKTIILFHIQAHVIKRKKLLSYTYSCSSSFISCWLYWRTFTTLILACFKLSNLSPRALLSTLCYAFLCCPKSIQHPCFTSQNTAHMPKFCQSSPCPFRSWIHLYYPR